MHRFQPMAGVQSCNKDTYVFVLQFKGEDYVVWVVPVGNIYNILATVTIYQQEVYITTYDAHGYKPVPNEVKKKALELLQPEPERKQKEQREKTLFRNSWAAPAIAFVFFYYAYPVAWLPSTRAVVRAITFVIYTTYTKLFMQIIATCVQHVVTPTQLVGMNQDFKQHMRRILYCHEYAIDFSFKLYLVLQVLAVLGAILFNTSGYVSPMCGAFWSVCSVTLHCVRGVWGDYKS